MPSTLSPSAHRLPFASNSGRIPAAEMTAVERLEEFDEWVGRYLRAFPDVPRGTEADWHRFKVWLPGAVPSLARQSLFPWLASLTTVEQHAARLRFAGLRFESLAEANFPATFDTLGSREILVHVNPSHVCAWRDLPVDASGERRTVAVLVFTWRKEVRTTLLGHLAEAVIQSLADGPKRLSVLEQLVELERLGELRELLRELFAQKILAMS